MAIRELDRLLLVPALIVLGSLTLAGCSLLPGGNDSTSSSSSDSSGKEDAEDDDRDDDSASTGCPSSFDTDLLESTAGADTEIISDEEFSVQAIGPEYLEGGCLFRVTIESEDSTAVTDFGYLPGDAETVAAISANLEAEGYTKIADGMFQLNEQEGVFVFDSGDTVSQEDLDELDLGFGDSFVIVMATNTGK